MFLTEPILFDLNAPIQAKVNSPDEDSLVWSVLTTNGVFIPLVAIFIALRIFAKFSIAKHVFVDDYLMIVSAMMFLAIASVDVAAVPLGFGRHIMSLPGSTLGDQITSVEHVLHYNFVSMVLISLSLCLAKLSIVATLLHIFNAKTLGTLRSILRFTAIIVVLCSAAQFFFVILQCSTVRLSWMISELGTAGTCSNLEVAVLVTGAIDCITDFVICCAPIPAFMRLQMPLRQRLCCSALFLSGGIVCVFGLMRVVSARGLGDDATAIDATYTAVPFFNWSVAEAGLCIITGSIPALRPLLAPILPQLFETHSMDDLVGSVKETVGRAASRKGPWSRFRAGSLSKSEHMRRSSEGTFESLPGSPWKHSHDECEIPTIRVAQNSGSRMITKVSAALGSVSFGAKHTVCMLKKGFHRQTLGAEERSRPRLSVIGEVEEVSNWRANGSKVKSLIRQVDVSGSVADVKWWWARSKWNPWRPKYPPGDPTSGIIIIMAEVEPTVPKKAVIQQESGYPPVCSSVSDGRTYSLGEILEAIS